VMNSDDRSRALDGVCARCGRLGLPPGSVARPAESRLCSTCADFGASRARRTLLWGWVVVGLVVIGWLAYAVESMREPDAPTWKEMTSGAVGIRRPSTGLNGLALTRSMTCFDSQRYQRHAAGTPQYSAQLQ
jgi:hypothetical protein